MTHEDEHDTAAPAAPPKRTAAGRAAGCAKALVVLLAVLFTVFYLVRFQAGRIGQRKLDAQLAAVDAREPNWRLDDVMAARERAKPADADNGGPLILAVADRLPNDWSAWQNDDDGQKWNAPRDPNRLPRNEGVAAARAAAARTAAARADALKLRDSRGAFFPVKVENNPMMTLLPHAQKCRDVVALLALEGRLAALDKDPGRAVSAARAALKVARALGDEPFMISQLVRMACAAVAAETAMQVLAWAEPTAGLAELQAELLAEAEFPYLTTGLRGERAAFDRLFAGVAEGTVTAEEFFRMGDGRTGPQHRALFRAYKPLVAGDRAKCLELFGKYLEAAQLPRHELMDAIRAIPLPRQNGFDPRYLGTNMLLPGVEQFATASLRTRANLLSAAACVACERFRLKHGRFPKELAELVPEFLAEVPRSPHEDKPLTFRAFDDRVAIYGWHDSPRFANREPPDDLSEPGRKGEPHGFRVWLPKSRALPNSDDEIPPPREKP